MRKALSVFVRTACAVGAVALAMSTSVNAQVKKYTFGYDQPHSTAYGIAGELSAPSRSRRANAEMHSTADPHQTSIATSFAASACSGRVDSSATSKGTIAEASQNFTGCPAAQQGARPRPKRRPLVAAADW